MTKLRKPEERECELCGRRETWDDDRETWTVAADERDAEADDVEADDTEADDAEADDAEEGEIDEVGDLDATDGDAIGDVHCVHEWDIDGSFQPIQ